MKVRVGYQSDAYGTIESTPDGLKLDGDQERLRHAVDIIADEGDPKDAPGGLDGFLRYMLRALNNGYWWTTEVTA